jgi:hypothetical protein
VLPWEGCQEVESQDYALSVREALECALRWRRINTKTRWMTKREWEDSLAKIAKPDL